MIGFVPYSFSRVKACLACGSGGHSQIANADIDPDDFGELFAGRFGKVNREGHEQIERLLWPVIPEFRVTYGGSLLNKRNVFVVALVGETDASVQGPDTDPAVALKGVVALIGVLHRWGTIVWRLVQPLKTFPGDLLAPMFSILLEFVPQSLLASPNLPFHATGQL